MMTQKIQNPRRRGKFRKRKRVINQIVERMGKKQLKEFLSKKSK